MSNSALTEPSQGTVLMTLEQVAHEYGFAINTLRNWRQANKGPTSRRIGRRVYYLRTDVDGWIAAQFN